MPAGTTHIIGCGDIGRRVATLYLDAGKTVQAWVRGKTSLQACEQLGLISHRIDLDQPFDLNAIGANTHILYTVPPCAKGEHDRDTRLRNFLKTINPQTINKFVLISTTGVYGNCGGAWVDETTPIKPKAARALRRADAEASLQKWAHLNAVDYLILRVPGIYAANRLPLKRIRAGTPVVMHDQAPWTNRIHADDLAGACFSALHLSVSNQFINVADDAPSSMSAYFLAVADYAGLPRPPEISLQQARQTLSAGMLTYLEESRRVDNSKMKSLLKIKLKYPTLKHGLRPLKPPA